MAYGLVAGRESSARKAFAEGATPEFVRKITGLDMETIRGLAKARRAKRRLKVMCNPLNSGGGTAEEEYTRRRGERKDAEECAWL